MVLWLVFFWIRTLRIRNQEIFAQYYKGNFLEIMNKIFGSKIFHLFINELIKYIYMHLN